MTETYLIFTCVGHAQNTKQYLQQITAADVSSVSNWSVVCCLFYSQLLGNLSVSNTSPFMTSTFSFNEKLRAKNKYEKNSKLCVLFVSFWFFFCSFFVLFVLFLVFWHRTKIVISLVSHPICFWQACFQIKFDIAWDVDREGDESEGISNPD